MSMLDTPLRMSIFSFILVATTACVSPRGDVATTGSIVDAGGDQLSPASTLKATRDGQADLNLGKRYYRERNFGLAEKHYRKFVEVSPSDPEGWVGLAATYDQLGRFELADRAYEQAIMFAGTTPEILNNQGYSLMLRGNYKGAREKLEQAHSLDPENQFINANLELLAEKDA